MKLQTLHQFDYYLWKNNEGRCFIRVKSTGESCEVNIETFRLLRNEEKKMRRTMQQNAENESKFSAEELQNGLSSFSADTPCQQDDNDYEAYVMVKLLICDFCKNLTPLQIKVFQKCVLEKMSYSELARQLQISEGSIRWSMKKISEKIKKFSKSLTNC